MFHPTKRRPVASGVCRGGRSLQRFAFLLSLACRRGHTTVATMMTAELIFVLGGAQVTMRLKKISGGSNERAAQCPLSGCATGTSSLFH